MLAVALSSQHRVSSSKTVRPRAPCGARCIGHAVRTWSTVCSEAPHSLFGEGARPEELLHEEEVVPMPCILCSHCLAQLQTAPLTRPCSVMIVNLQQKSIYFLIKAWSYIYIKRHSCNEHDHLVDEAEFLEVNTNYPYIHCADDPETIVSIRDFFAPRQENF